MKLNQRSSIITEGPSRAPARAMMKALGLTDEDLQKPLIGIANTWIETTPCNSHLRRLSEKVKEGVRAAGGTAEMTLCGAPDGENPRAFPVSELEDWARLPGVRGTLRLTMIMGLKSLVWPLFCWPGGWHRTPDKVKACPSVRLPVWACCNLLHLSPNLPAGAW